MQGPCEEGEALCTEAVDSSPSPGLSGRAALRRMDPAGHSPAGHSLLGWAPLCWLCSHFLFPLCWSCLPHAGPISWALLVFLGHSCFDNHEPGSRGSGVCTPQGTFFPRRQAQTGGALPSQGSPAGGSRGRSFSQRQGHQERPPERAGPKQPRKVR